MSSVDTNDSRRWWVLGLVGTAQLMVVLDVTIMNIALPSAQDALGFSDSGRQWIITAYALAFGGLLLVGGRLGDLFGRKRTFVVGLIGFAAISAVGGAAQSFGMLAAARALQGAFAALLAPAALSLLTTTFSDPGERGKAFGIFGAISIGGAVVGLLLGGVLTEYLSWRWCLYVNLALAVPTALVALSVLTDEARSATARIDIRGALTVVPGLFALVYGLSKAETDGWGSATTLGFLAVGLALLVAFAAFERRIPHPLLPPRIVLDRNRGGSYLAVGIVGVGLMGGLFLLTFYLQQTLAYSPVTTGFAFLPLLAGIMASSISSSTLLLPRTGPRPLIVTGMLLAAAGMVVFAQLGVHSPYASHVLPGLILVGVGLGLVIAPAINTATLGVEASDAGVASATVTTMQQVGGSIGTAVLSVVSASAASSFLAGDQSTPALVAQATVHGYTTAFWWAAAIFAAGSVVCGLVLGGRRVERSPIPSPSAA